MGQSKRKVKTSKQRCIVGTGGKFYPMLKKVGVAIGKYINVPGAYWTDCPRKDKEKTYKCLVVEYIAIHDFGGAFKSSGFKVRAAPLQLLRCCQ